MKVEALDQQLDHAVRNRIYAPFVLELYQEFRRRGIYDAQLQILTLVDDLLLPPLLHTMSTHVNREKAVFVQAIANKAQIKKEQANVLAASIELLWTLSLMVDDVLDQDTKRGSLRTSWVEFGLEATLTAAKHCKQVIACVLVEQFGNAALEVFEFYIAKGLASIEKHRHFNLFVSRDQMLMNYVDRCDFLSGLPVTIIFGLGNKVGSPTYQEALLGMQLFNQTGQLLNDLKDLDEQDIYRRGPSDIRNGLVTLPIQLLFEALSDKEKQGFVKFFDRSLPSQKDPLFLKAILAKYSVWELMEKRVLDGYGRALKLLSEAVTDADLSWFKRWVEYKISRVNLEGAS